MAKKNKLKTALFSAILSMIVCISMFAGTTFAWFTDSVVSIGNKIVAGRLDVDLELKTSDGWISISDTGAPIFNYDKWEPGYSEVKMLKIVNNGSLALMWKARFVSSNELGILADVIDVYVLPSDSEPTMPDRSFSGYTHAGTIREFVNTIEDTTYGSLNASESKYLTIGLKMQESANNDYQNADLGAFDIQIVATQLSAENDSFDNTYDNNADYLITDKWDGKMDKSWFTDELKALVETATAENPVVINLDSAEQFAGFINLTNTLSFKNVTAKLNCDIDMAGTNWNEGGAIAAYTPAFNGTLDGNGHTIKNLSAQNNWAYANAMFRTIGHDATIKNLVIDGANISSANSTNINHEYGILVGIVGSGTLTLENITIKNSSVSTKASAGLFVGGMTEGAIYVKNCSVDNCHVNVLASNGLGGVVLGNGWSHHDYDYAGVFVENLTVTNSDYTIAGVLQPELPLYNYEK